MVNLKNSYQSAFSHYLAGFVYEALGEKGLAAPGYRQAAELRPGTPLLEQALLDLDATPAADAGSDVLLVLQSGLAPARDSLRIPLPVPLDSGMIISTLSFPLLRDDTSTLTPGFIEVDGAPAALTELSSLRAMSHRALRDDMPGIILRTTIRAVTRGALQKQLNDNGNPWPAWPRASCRWPAKGPTNAPGAPCPAASASRGCAWPWANTAWPCLPPMACANSP